MRNPQSTLNAEAVNEAVKDAVLHATEAAASLNELPIVVQDELAEHIHGLLRIADELRAYQPE